MRPTPPKEIGGSLTRAATAVQGSGDRKIPALSLPPPAATLTEEEIVCICTFDMNRKRDMTSMENCLCFNLRRVSRGLSQFFVSELHGHGLLPTQTPILGALAAHPGTGMAELSDWLGMDRTTLVRNLRPLEREGLVEASGKGRGNKVSLQLTPKGKAALARFLPDWREAQRKVMATLGEARWAAILADLERAAAALHQ